MQQILITAGVVAPIISAIVNVFKTQFKLDGKQVSALALGLGIIVGIAYAATIVHGDYAAYGWGGLIAGLSAIGYYELAFKNKKGDTTDDTKKEN
ncbi:hypothetical protein [Streptococcus anginosus]|uniref:Holin n=1 Tax=Streptococcus anginosus TaxID=1328 RepID=A0A6G4N120_STRAP|nr:hypothetical protein [Streptococcus anginosus]MCW0988490.1 hypothetical protein [Streptococcus anginosus]NGG16937.1 hypothetical protein [Streptococcus anginosus]NGG24307.1 hypothetical protein [Streptococcus anginosus]